MATQYAFGSIVTNGLVLALNAADKNSYPGSGTTWTDMSGNGANMSLLNSPIFSSVNGGAITFDGVDDYAQSSTVVLPTANNSPLTLEAFAMTTAGGSWKTVLGTAYTFTQIGFNANNFYAGRNGGGGNLLVLVSAVNPDTWYQLVMTYNGSTADMYLNGALIKASQNIGSNGNSNGVNTLSSYTINVAAEPLAGKIAIARVYNRALSASEVAQNYNAQKSRFGL
jgi:hypothetical protein